MDSLWQKSVEISKRPPLDRDIQTTAAVIGGGMAGMLIAFYLQKKGIDTIVLEANRIGSGQTGNTTAKITASHNLIYNKLITQFGVKKAQQYATASQEAIEEYDRIIKDKSIDCEFVRCPSYLYSQLDDTALCAEVEAAKQLGLDVEFTVQTELPFPVKGAAKFNNQARFHPLKFLKEISEGITVYEQTKVKKVKDDQIDTENGTVHAKYIIFACHFPFMNIPGYYFSRMHQERSYVVAYEQVPAMQGMYLGIDDNALSFRKSGAHMLLGGLGHRTGENPFGGRYDQLRTTGKILWPDSREVAAWSAQDCMTLDGVPYIGQYAASTPSWYVACGFQKWGMTNSMVAALLISDQIMGIENPWEEVFTPQRFQLSPSAKNMIEEGIQVIKGLAKTGEKRCKHLGCQVEWNPDERSYDCPCHGSRYGENGELLDGPAQEDLPND